MKSGRRIVASRVNAVGKTHIVSEIGGKRVPVFKNDEDGGKSTFHPQTAKRGRNGHITHKARGNKGNISLLRPHES